MVAIYLVIVEAPWWMAVILYLVSSTALALLVGQMFKVAGAHDPVEREVPRAVETHPHRPTW